MRKLFLVLITVCSSLLFTSCNGDKATPPASKEPVKVIANTTDSVSVPPDSIIQFLIVSSASDFHTHPTKDHKQVRDVRLGHRLTDEGQKQYFISGEFLSSAEKTKGTWMTFTTIKMSDYEQWLGPQAKTFAQDPAVIWDHTGDLSSLLQRQMDSLGVQK